MLHGFPDHERSFDAQLPVLAAAGHRAVAVRMRGYEPSSQPEDGDYRPVCMAEDVLGWIDELGAKKVHLVGHDWGSIIAQAAVAMAPERFASLVLIAVPRLGPLGRLIRSDRRQFRRSLYGLFFQWRGISDWWVRRANFVYLERLWRRWSPGWKIADATLDGMKAVFAQPGVLGAALSYYRQSRDPVSARLLRTPIGVPAMGLYGARDGCIGADIFERAMPAADFPAGLSLHRIEEAGHFLHLEQADEVNMLLLRWLDARSDAA
ncbi:MAG: alpha/beta hydrolase [Sphingopyxis sp.]|nr:alpha/beta hydrolase [Sphingopyxis sp.]